jgi:hypothetical protein
MLTRKSHPLYNPKVDECGHSNANIYQLLGYAMPDSRNYRIADGNPHKEVPAPLRLQTPLQPVYTPR